MKNLFNFIILTIVTAAISILQGCSHTAAELIIASDCYQTAEGALYVCSKVE